MDAMRELEKEGVFRKFHETFYATVGNGTSVGNVRFGAEIAQKPSNDNVDAVIVTSTRGTCTRCGRNDRQGDGKRAGLPVVHVCTIVPISLTGRANRIVPAVAIPHPLGDPSRTSEEEKKIRRALVEKAPEGT